MKRYQERQMAAFEQAKEFSKQDQWELAYESLLDFDRQYDEELFSEFRNRGCNVEPQEIYKLDSLGCSTLVVAISRQLYWDEPPLCSINGKLVDFDPVEFAYKTQIRALIERLKVLYP